MNNLDIVIDFGSNNLRLGVFDKSLKNIYSSEKKITDSLENFNQETSLSTLIKDAEKYLSTHIDNVVVLYDSPKFYTIDISIKKSFDYATSIKKVYNYLIDEAKFIISQNYFKDQIIHLIVNNILADDDKKLDTIIQDIKIKSLILEIKFICLHKTLIKNISNQFKKNNLKILNLYCSSYIKAFAYKKNFSIKDYIIFLDIGYERTSSLIFNNNKFEFFKSIALGSNNLTKDISKVLNLSLDHSEVLKLGFNQEENSTYLGKNDKNKINPYSEIFEKNISINLLKQIIEERIDEIIELVLLNSSNIKKLNSLIKPKLVITGGGSKLFSKNYKLSINRLISEFNIYENNDSYTCEHGLNYDKSNESYLIKTKENTRKSGLFERFFNLFSK